MEEALEWIRRGGEDGMVAMVAGASSVYDNQLNTCALEQCCVKVVGGRKGTDYLMLLVLCLLTFLRFRKKLSRPSFATGPTQHQTSNLLQHLHLTSITINCGRSNLAISEIHQHCSQAGKPLYEGELRRSIEAKN